MNIATPNRPDDARLWWVAVGMALSLIAASATALWHLRQDALAAQTRELSLLSLALADEVERSLQGAEEGLLAIRGELASARLPSSGADAQLALQTRVKLMPLVQTLWLLGDGGQLIAGSDTSSAPEPASFLPALAGLAVDDIAISRPFRVDALPEAGVALAVRFRAAPGIGDGWIVAALPATGLLGAFSAASPAADARMAVFRADGARLAGLIVDNQVLDEATLAQRLASRTSMELHRFRDGSERLVGLHRLQRYGLSVVMTRDIDAVLHEWREAARLTAAALGLALLVLLAAVLVVHRADRRRSEAQQALQAQQARAGKLESLGTLAGSVAHDFNNLLASIVGFGEMARDLAPADGNQARYLDRVLQAAERGKSLVERILSFSKGGAQTSDIFELGPVIEEVLDLLAGSLRPGLVLERALEAPGAMLRGDSTQAYEAVLNLCTNALQAMPDGGMVSVHLQRLQIDEAQVLSHSQLAPGHYLELSVADQGRGITPAVMEHLFEPFFTTRSSESGTGLGLAVVHGVVAEFGGAIDVRSRPGKGARFTLYLPEYRIAEASDQPQTEMVVASAPSTTARSATTVLVIDDETALVDLLTAMLRGLGYQAEGSSDPRAALQLLREQPTRYTIVITDETMPGLSGTAMTEALREFAPGLPVLLISGYGGPALAERALAAGVTRVLAKPIERAELAQALDELLA